MNPGIIIPTWNERTNLPTLVKRIKRLHPDINIIIVDDNSPDATGKVAESLAGELTNIYAIHRPKREGFGAAVIDGFRLALEKNFDPVITMDGDLSHDPIYIKNFILESAGYDLVIGSRYIGGVRVDGWRFRKLLLSKLANMYVAYLMVKPIWDFTSGFRAYSANFLSKIDLDSIHTTGYLFQIHMIHLAYAHKMRVKEIPFLYKDTEYGFSKINSRDRRITFIKVWNYRAPLMEIIRHLTYIRKDYHRFVEEYDELLNPAPLKIEPSYILNSPKKISVGIMAYNEEKNISACLNALLQQKLESCEILEIIVVSSGSIDRTDEIATEFQKANPKIKLIVQKERCGKAAAINEFLNNACGDICILESADTVTEPTTIEQLVQPFSDLKIGMVGAHPVPINSNKTIVGYWVNKLWRLHHLMALENPKCGEMVAFRNILTRIPSYTAVDEATIESLFRENGFGICYVPEAVVHNKGPVNLSDFFKQRLRIATGHKHLSSTKGYRVATFKSLSILRYVIKDMDWSPKGIICTAGLMCMEALARSLGALNFHLRDKNPFVWDIAQSTKTVELSESVEEHF